MRLSLRSSSLAAAILIFGTIVSGVVACSLFTDLSELDQKAPPTDAGGAADTLPTLSPPGDSGNDGPGPDGTAAPISTCPDGGFCDDFNELPIGARWSRVRVQNGGLLLREEVGPSASSPFSFRPTTSDASVGAQLAYLEHVVKTIPKSLRCSFDLRLNEDPLSGQAGPLDVFQLSATNADFERYYLKFAQIKPNKMELREDVTPTGQNCLCPRKGVPAIEIPIGAWTRVDFDIQDFKNVKISFNNSVVLADTFMDFIPTDLSIFLGLQTFDTAATSASYDNFECTFTY